MPFDPDRFEVQPTPTTHFAWLRTRRGRRAHAEVIYRPAARLPQPIDTSTSHLGMRLVVRDPRSR